MLPSFLAHTLPMALLIAVLLAGGRLASDLEITAFKAAGVSALRLFRPVLGASLLVALLTAGLTLFVNPAANGEFQRQLFRIVQVRAMSALQERVFNDTFGGLTIYVEDVSASQIALRGLLVSNERDPTLSRIITAREGRLLTDELNRSITLRLMNGAVNEADILPADPPRDFTTKDVPTAGGAASSARYRYTSFDIYDMSLSMDSPLQNALRVEKPEKDLTLAELGAKIAEYRNDPHGRAPFQIERHKRYALPLAALVFGLVAFPLAIRSHRGGRSIALVGSLAILVTYYLVMTSLEGVALNTRIPSAVAIWAPNVLLTIVGLGLLVATAREWRWPAMPGVWRGLEALRRAVPSRPLWRRRRGPGEARDSTHIIDRYLVRQYVTFMGIGLAVAAALFVVIDLVKTLDKYLRVKPPLMYILEHFAYRLPAALHDGLPVVMLVATIFLFLSLRRYHDLTALKAEGVRLNRGSATVLGVGVVVGFGSGVVTVLAFEVLEDFLRIQKPVSTMSFWELRDYIGQLEAAGFQIRKYLVELYSKLSFPLVNLVMVLVAIPFALQSPRGGRLFGIGLAIVIMAGYLVVHYAALAFARADLLPPLIAAWTANVIFMGIGLSLLLRART